MVEQLQTEIRELLMEEHNIDDFLNLNDGSEEGEEPDEVMVADFTDFEFITDTDGNVIQVKGEVKNYRCKVEVVDEDGDFVKLNILDDKADKDIITIDPLSVEKYEFEKIE